MPEVCDFSCGWMAGVCGLIVGHPADTIKVRQQTLGGISAWRCARATVQYEGVLGFYKGMSFPMLAAGVMNSVFFGVYGMSLRLLQGPNTDQQHSLSSVFLAGCIGGLSQVGVSCSVDLVKIKLQAQTGTSQTWGKHYEAGYRGPIDCVSGVIRADGYRGIFRGLVPTIFRDVPAFGVYMAVYEGVVRAMLQQRSRESSTIPLLVAGGLAGSVSWGLIVPLDVIKSRMQADCPEKPQYRGMLDCISQSYRKDGLQVFSRGFWMVVLRAFPVNAAIFLGYERCMSACSYLIHHFARTRQESTVDTEDKKNV